MVTSQFFGAGDDKSTRRAISNSAYVMLFSALLMGLMAYLAAPTVLKWMGTPEEILHDALIYMRVNCLGVPMVAVYNYASSMQRALGDSRTPLYFLVASCLLNIGLDLLFVCGLGLSVFGAALATVIAQFLAGALCWAWAARTNPYFRLEKEEYRPDGAIILRSVRLGLPLAMQWSMISVSSIALQTFVNSFGTAAVAAFTATNRVESLLHQPYGSLGAALSTYAGQNWGAGHTSRVRDGVKQGLLLSTGFSLVMLAVIQLLSRPIMTVFVTEPDVILIGGQALCITSGFYAFLGFIYVVRGALNGVGDALFAFINGTVEMAARIFIPVLMLRLIPAAGMWSIWWTTCLTWVISALFCFLRYRSWKRKNATEANDVGMG